VNLIQLLLLYKYFEFTFEMALRDMYLVFIAYAVMGMGVL